MNIFVDTGMKYMIKIVSFKYVKIMFNNLITFIILQLYILDYLRCHKTVHVISIQNLKLKDIIFCNDICFLTLYLMVFLARLLGISKSTSLLEK